MSWRGWVGAAMLASVVSTGVVWTAEAEARAPVPPVNAEAETRVAIHGYDAVAYFTQSTAIEGTQEFEHPWQGATWRFSSAENRDLFAAEPEKYAPQYGGYCAWAVSKGYTYDADPTAWQVVDGKLYLNYNARIQNKWGKAAAENIQKGDVNWPKLITSSGQVK